MISIIQKKLIIKRIVLSVLSLLILTFIITVVFSFVQLKSDKIYSGVYVKNLNAGNLTKNELSKALNDNYSKKAENLEITIKCKDNYEKLSFKEMSVDYNVESVVESAYFIGHSGDIITRLRTIYDTNKNGKTLDLNPSYDNTIIEKKLQILYEKTVKKVVEADLSIQDEKEKAILKAGISGESIDKDFAINAIKDLILSCEATIIEVPLKKDLPVKLNADELYKKIYKDAKDASFKTNGKEIDIIPHSYGRNINKSSLEEISSKLTEGSEITLPVEFIKPKIQEKDLIPYLLRDTIGIMSTVFDTSSKNNANRGHNIRLAVEKLNGKIIGPGETFSFNETVGPRTEADGYKVAHAYIGGKVVDDAGGGICQVSTTLYNAILFADLEIIERSNHMFTVGYVPYGRDAAVAYGSMDLKFRNNTNWPIKIESWVTASNNLFFNIKGTNDTPGKKIELYSKTTKTINFPINYTDSEDIGEGEEIVTQWGMPGYEVETYKVTKLNGIIQDESKIHISRYTPLSQEVKRGKLKTANNKI